VARVIQSEERNPKYYNWDDKIIRKRSEGAINKKGKGYYKIFDSRLEAVNL